MLRLQPAGQSPAKLMPSHTDVVELCEQIQAGGPGVASAAAAELLWLPIPGREAQISLRTTRREMTVTFDQAAVDAVRWVWQDVVAWRG